MAERFALILISISAKERLVFGTVARVRVKPGMADRMLEHSRQYEDLDIPGHKGLLVYQSESDPDEFFMAVVFESRDAYVANASSDRQHERYLELRELLAGEPEWHDGAVVQADLV
jgi:heme-degrading monooxygenase HmoA